VLPGGKQGDLEFNVGIERLRRIQHGSQRLTNKGDWNQGPIFTAYTGPCAWYTPSFFSFITIYFIQ
jgi:hypothetical protein